MTIENIICLLVIIFLFLLSLLCSTVKTELLKQKAKLIELEIEIERLENDLLNVKTDINYILIEFNQGITNVVSNIREIREGE